MLLIPLRSQMLLHVGLTFLLAVLVIAKPLGVDVSHTGVWTVGIDDKFLNVSGKGKCDALTFFWYPVTKVLDKYQLDRPGHCSFNSQQGFPIPAGTLPCPLKVDKKGLIDIDVTELGSGCTLTLANAYLPSASGEDGGSIVLAVSIAVPIGVVLLVAVLALLAWCFVRPWWRRRKPAAAVASAMPQDEPDLEQANVPVPRRKDSVPLVAQPHSIPPATVPSSTAPSTVPPSTSTTPEPLKPTPSPVPTKKPSSTPAPLLPRTPVKPVSSAPPTPEPNKHTTPTATKTPPPTIAKPTPKASSASVPAASSGSSGRRRRKKLELSTEDFVEADKVTGAPRPRKEPRKKKKLATSEPVRVPPPLPAPPSAEDPRPTLSNEKEERKPGRVEAATALIKASAKATADECCPDDKTHPVNQNPAPAKRQKERLVKFPLSDSQSRQTASTSQEQPEKQKGGKKSRRNPAMTKTQGAAKASVGYQ